MAPVVHLDCDPGHDDALALAVASRFSSLRSISTVAGNDRLERVTQNACVAAAVLAIDAPIHAGARRSMRNDFVAYTEMPSFAEALGERCPTPRSRARESAATVLADPSMSGWIVATGPLTNVASALLADPSLAKRLDGIAFMGGCIGAGNVTAAAEFNVRCDPEALAVVLEAESDTEIRMVGLDVTHQVLIDGAFLDALASPGSRAGRLVSVLLGRYVGEYPDAFVDQPVAPIHDPCAVLAVTHPELFDWRRLRVDVELSGDLTRGATVVDTRGPSVARPGNVSVAVGVDANAVVAMVVDAVRGS